MSLLPSSMTKAEEPVDIKMVRYELNTVENLKKAKDGLYTRHEIPNRKVTDDQNTTLEIHPAIYLEIKKNLQYIKKGDESKDEGLGVKMKVTYIRRSQTPRGDSPGAIVRMDVTNLQTGEASKCVQHFYHTKQNIHLQGGHRMGKVSTTSLVADYLEKELAYIVETRKELLYRTTKILSDMDVEKFEADLKKQNKTTKKPSDTSIMFPCDQCGYKSIYEWNVIRHKKIAHEKEVITSVKRSLEPQRVSFADTVKQDTSGITSPPGKKTRDVTKEENNKTNEIPNNVEQEIVAVVENLESTNNEKDEKIKTLEDKTKEKDQKIRVLNETVYNLESSLKEAQHHLKETIAERDLVRGEFNDIFKAAEKLNTDKLKVEVDYKEVVQKIHQSTRENEEMKETLKVTEDILKAMETERRQLEDDEEVEDEDEDNEEMEGDWAEDQNVNSIKINQGNESCKKCDQKFNGSIALQDHMKSHMKEDSMIFTCSHCDYNTGDGGNFLKHMADAHINVTPCLTCKKTFKGKEALAAHVIKVHAKKSSPTGDKCTQCGKVFPSIEILMNHIIRDHYLINPRTEEATSAGQQLEESWSLQQTRSNHLIKCHDCGENVGDRSNIMRHKRERHYKEKLCRAYHEYGHCERNEESCIYIHSNQGDQSNQPRRNLRNIMCRNGFDCIWKTQNRCKFGHSRPASYVESQQNPQPTSSSTSDATMRAILERLVRMEQLVPNIQSMTDFPPITSARKSQ